MKKFVLSISIFLAIAVTISLVFNESSTTSKADNGSKSYFPEKISSQDISKSANGAIAYKNIMYQDITTNQINYAQLAKAKSKVKNRMFSKSSDFSFVEEGPDNIGGRTRAIAIHPVHDNIMFAGSVSGGLFKTVNAGNNWERVQEFDDAMLNSATGTGSLGVSSIAITRDTVLYVATGGSQFEGSLESEYSANITGDGLWYSQSLTNLNFTQLPETNNDDIHKVVADPTKDNSVYFVGLSHGLRHSENFVTLNTDGISTTSKVLDFRISDDGQLMILGYPSGTRIETMISQDGGDSWTNLHDNEQLEAFGTKRVEYSISSESGENGYVIYAVFASSSGTLSGVYRSQDNGTTWCQIGQYTNGFTPLSTTLSQQGNYDLVILSSQDGESCMLGGINLWKWQHSVGGACSSGQWNQETYSFLPNFLGPYTHADNHRLLYNNNGDLIVGNDGGIQIRYKEPFGSVAIEQLPLNKGYSVTQFYAMAFDGEGSVIAGAQDNGTLYKDNTQYNHWDKDFREVTGGDGFECAISYLNSNAMISTVYNGSISRSNDRGETFQQVNFGTSATDPFYNALALMENAEDLNTKDSVFYSPDIAKSAGDTIIYYSSTLNVPIKHILTDTLHVYNTFDTVISLGDTDVYVTRDSTDTLILPDYVQSYFITQRGNGAYITRDMLRFSTNPEWWKLFEITGNDLHSHEISTDMNYAWSGSYFNGKITRVSGLANAYTQQAADLNFKPSTSDTLLLASSIPNSTDQLILISPKITNSDTLLLIDNLPELSDTIINISPKITSTDTIVNLLNSPLADENIIWIDSIPSSSDSLIALANVPQSSDSLLETANLPESSAEILLIDVVPTNSDSLVEKSSIPTSSDSLLETANLPESSAEILLIDIVPTSSDSLVEKSSIPTSSDSLLETANLPESSAEILLIDIVPTSSDSLVEISSGDTITGIAVDAINLNSEYELYTFIDGSAIGDTIMGSDFLSSVDFASDEYFYLDGNPINVLVTGGDVDNINFITSSDQYTYIDSSPIDIFVTDVEIDAIDFSTSYSLYTYVDGSAIGDTIMGSDFLSSVDFASDEYFYLDGTPINVLVTGGDVDNINFITSSDQYTYIDSSPIDIFVTDVEIDAIDFSTSYSLYTYVDGSAIGDTIMGSDFLSSVDFASDEYFYLDGTPINVLVTGGDVDNINFITSSDQYTYIDSSPIDIFVTDVEIDAIDFSNSYSLYTFVDGSLIYDTILGSSFEILDAEVDIYAFLDGTRIQPLITGENIDTVNFNIYYNNYTFLNNNLIGDTIVGSDFYSINLSTDDYFNLDGSLIDVVRTGSEISSIDFSSDYNLYNYTDGSSVGDTILGSDFGTINLYSDFYTYLDGTSVDAVVTGTSISQIDFENNYSLYKWHYSTQSSSLNGTALEYCIGTKTINLTGTVSDISIDPKNPDNVCIVIGGTGGNHVYYSSNATSSNPTFSAIDGDLPDMPVFGCVIEKDPATDVIIIGTEYGVFSTDNINGNNTSWTANNAEIGPIPIFDICQQWRDWEDGYDNGVRRVRNSGSIYACTFGRGIWRADNLLSIAEPYVINEANGINQLSLYPNPTKDNANISFTLNSSSDVSVQVFDLSGKVVKSIYNNYPFTRGTHNMNFSVEGLQLGTYLVLVKSNTEQKVVKFIKY